MVNHAYTKENGHMRSRSHVVELCVERFQIVFSGWMIQHDVLGFPNLHFGLDDQMCPFLPPVHPALQLGVLGCYFLEDCFPVLSALSSFPLERQVLEILCLFD